MKLEISEHHLPFIAALLAKSTGAIGEILVADALVALGYSVVPLNNNTPQADLHVTSPNGRLFFIEVKTDRARRPTWFVRSIPDVDVSTIWCFVVAPREPCELPDIDSVEIYVLTAKETRDIWLASDWNRAHPDNGDIRRHQIPDESLNAWHKLPA